MNARIPLAALALSLASTLAFAATPAATPAPGAVKSTAAATPTKKQVAGHAAKCKSDEVAVKGQCKPKSAN